jgi:hypothetical protein
VLDLAIALAAAGGEAEPLPDHPAKYACGRCRWETQFPLCLDFLLKVEEIHDAAADASRTFFDALQVCATCFILSDPMPPPLLTASKTTARARCRNEDDQGE